MISNQSELFSSLHDALNLIRSASGLHLNESFILRRQEIGPSIINLIPLILGSIGFIFNILALIIFTASKTFRQSSFRCYIYAFVLVNCASILTHSWFYLFFYLVDPMHLCKYIQYLQRSLSTASHWIMIFLSVERSFTFIKPYTVKTVHTRLICLLIFVSTCFWFLLHLDEIFFVDIIAYRWINFAYGTCSRKYHSHFFTDRIKILTHTISFLIPFLFNSILNIYICYNICQRRKRFFKRSSSNCVKKKSRRSKISLANEITLTLLCQSIWLLLTYIPQHVYYSLLSFQIIKDYDRDNSTLVFLIRQNLLIYLAFSPTLFVILSPTLRREIRSYLCQTYKRRRTSNSLSIASVNKPFGHFFNSITFKQPSRSSSWIITTRSVELPRKFPSESRQTVSTNKDFLQIKSHSSSCITMKGNLYDFEQYKTTEQSSTLNQ